MKKVACIKFAGYAAGGTEKALQNIATILASSKKYSVDYFYTNAAPFIGCSFVHPDNSDERKKWVESYGVSSIPIFVESKTGNRSPFEWNNTNFWNFFDEKKYDIIQTARGGYTEYPFNLINQTSIIDGIHSDSGEDKENIKKAILISKWQANKWASNGGNIKKAVVIPNLVFVPEKQISTLRKILNIPEDHFIFGFHQRNDPAIFSPISLQAFSAIQKPNYHFVLLGGSEQHRIFAKNQNLKNIHFLNFTSNQNDIHNFLSGIDVFAHSRIDGEVCSVAMIEAMSHNKPIVTHPGTVSMGHAEQIEGCGHMAFSIDDYAKHLEYLASNKDYYCDLSEKTKIQYQNKYAYDVVKKQILDLYDTVLN